MNYSNTIQEPTSITSIELFQKLECINSFKSINKGEILKVTQKIPYRWMDGYSFRVVIIGNDIFKTPRIEAFDSKDIINLKSI